MKITVTKRIEEEVDVQYPSYFSYAATYHKVVSEDKWITVTSALTWESNCETSITVHSEKPAWYGNVLTDGNRISEEQFNEAHKDALVIIAKAV